MGNEGRITLILGGARAGKSRYAQEMAARASDKVTFVATAQVLDDEMARRVEAHRQSRPSSWHTVEAPLRVADALGAEERDCDVILLDCLTLLAANVLGEWEPSTDDAVAIERARERLQEELAGVIAWLGTRNRQLIVVSNEVGLGLVPTTPLGRAYRDVLGWANQWLAARADRVYLMVAGLPLVIKDTTGVN